jgi:epoxyqueuosine reductase
MRFAVARVPRQPPPALPEDPAALSAAAVESARRNGFVAAGVLRATRPATFDVFRRWMEAGLHGEMAFLEQDAAARMGFDAILPYTKSVLAVALDVPGRGAGNVAKYARGEDYHRVVRQRLKAVVAEIRPLAPEGTHFRVCVDTAPLLERDIAVRAGLGFIGKNGMLIVPGAGSNVVLGEVLTDVALAPTAGPIDVSFDRCGTCTACLDACPTAAFLAPRLLDARKCISYLTIEKRGAFTPEEEAATGGRIFGCDICQDVCPFNAAHDPEGPARGPAASLSPEEVLALDDAGFEKRFFESAIWRATREGLQRNARAALKSTIRKTESTTGESTCS